MASKTHYFNARKKIEFYMKEKSDAIEVETDIPLYEDIDYNALNSGMNFGYILQRLNTDTLEGACPQCMEYGVHCILCSYASNHGRCGNEGSRFSKIDLRMGALGYNKWTPLLIELDTLIKYLKMA
jgi:hypothetical protein